jgi:hypothetical protein
MSRKSGHRLGAVERERLANDAWRLYLDNIPITTISRMLDLNRETVSNLIKHRREEEVARLTVEGQDLTNEFRLKHQRIRERCNWMLNWIEHFIALDEAREERLEEAIRERAEGIPLEEQTLEEQAGVLARPTRALKAMMVQPRNIAMLSHVLIKSLHEEARVLGLIGAGKRAGAVALQKMAELRALLADPLGTPPAGQS